MLKTLVKKTIHQLGFEIMRHNRPPEVDFEVDRRFLDLYEKAQGKCQMTSTDNHLRRQRHYTLNYLLWNADLQGGDVCELGCWRGLSAYQIASYLKTLSSPVLFHIFDSFAGLSAFQAEDLKGGPKDDPQIEHRRRQFACSLPEVQQNLKEFSFIKFYQGWIPERFKEVADRRFSFVHIDVDLYQPICESLQFFYPRLVKHGVMVLDDYGCLQFPGAKKAVDDCLAQWDRPFFIPLPSGQAFLIKDMKR